MVLSVLFDSGLFSILLLVPSRVTSEWICNKRIGSPRNSQAVRNGPGVLGVSRVEAGMVPCEEGLEGLVTE